jgi:hypothetical protein
MSERQIVVFRSVEAGLQDGAAVAGNGASEPPGVAEQTRGGDELVGDPPGWRVTDEGGLGGQESVGRDAEGLVEEREHGELRSMRG